MSKSGTKLDNRKVAFFRQRPYEDLKCIFSELHSILGCHTATTVNDKSKVEIFASDEHRLLGHLIFDQLIKVLRLYRLECWHKGNSDGNSVVQFCIL